MLRCVNVSSIVVSLPPLSADKRSLFLPPLIFFSGRRRCFQKQKGLSSHCVTSAGHLPHGRLHGQMFRCTARIIASLIPLNFASPPLSFSRVSSASSAAHHRLLLPHPHPRSERPVPVHHEFQATGVNLSVLEDEAWAQLSSLGCNADGVEATGLVL